MRLPVLGERYSSRSNGWGLIRISLTFGVLVAHSWPIGFGTQALGLGYTRGQIDFGSVCLESFFLVSGFLITGSALRLSWRRYLWCRFLRVMPGFWVCLLVTAFVFGPFAAFWENGTLHGYWSHPDGPFSYVSRNWSTAMDQFPISGLLAHTPFGELTGGPSGFNGSVWTLRYEIGCYVAMLALAATAVLRRRRWVVPALACCLFALALRDVVANGDVTYHPIENHLLRVPVMGVYASSSVLYFGFMFLLGSSFYLYRDRIPVHASLAGLALAVFAGTAAFGGVYSVGLPALGYLLVYAAVRVPDRWKSVGRRHDYSFGIYIYAFPIQQLLALVGATVLGPWGYLALTAIVTSGLAVLSWHYVERPLLALKDIRLPRRAPRRTAQPALFPDADRQPEPERTAP